MARLQGYIVFGAAPQRGIAPMATLQGYIVFHSWADYIEGASGQRARARRDGDLNSTCLDKLLRPDLKGRPANATAGPRLARPYGLTEQLPSGCWAEQSRTLPE